MHGNCASPSYNSTNPAVAKWAAALQGQPTGYYEALGVLDPSALPDAKCKYTRCTVIGSSITVMLLEDGMNTQTAITVLPTRLPGNGAYTRTILNDITEMKYARQKFIESSSGNLNCWRTIKMYMTTKKIFGISKRQVLDDLNNYSYNCNAGAPSPPALPWYWNILFHFPWSSTQNTIDYNMKITMTHYCVFSGQNITAPDH